MRKLEVNQMESLQGGSELLDFIVGSATCTLIGMALPLGTFGHVFCHAMLHSTPAH